MDKQLEPTWINLDILDAVIDDMEVRMSQSNMANWTMKRYLEINKMKDEMNKLITERNQMFITLTALESNQAR